MDIGGLVGQYLLGKGLLLCGSSDRFYFAAQISNFTSHYTECVQISNRVHSRLVCAAARQKPFPERRPFVCCLSVWCERFYVRLGGAVHPSSISRGNNVKSFVRERREG